MIDPLLKNVNGQELYHLHELVKQNMRVLEAMNYDSLETFISLITDLKLDQSSMFMWPNYSRDHEVSCILRYWNSLRSGLEHWRTLSMRMIRSTTLVVMVRNPLPNRIWLIDIQDSCMTCNVVNHQLHKCKEFAPCLATRKWCLLRRMSFAWTA